MNHTINSGTYIHVVTNDIFSTIVIGTILPPVVRIWKKMFNLFCDMFYCCSYNN